MEPGKKMGGFMSGVRRRLRASGLSEKDQEAAMAAIRGGKPKAIKIPRAVIRKLAEVLMEHRRAVVSMGKGGGFRVYTPAGHKAAGAAMIKAKEIHAAKGN